MSMGGVIINCSFLFFKEILDSPSVCQLNERFINFIVFLFMSQENCDLRAVASQYIASMGTISYLTLHKPGISERFAQYAKEFPIENDTKVLMVQDVKKKVTFNPEVQERFCDMVKSACYFIPMYKVILTSLTTVD
jgi:hypothetical protein